MLPLFVLSVVLLLQCYGVESSCDPDPCTVQNFYYYNCDEWKDVAFLSTDQVSYEHAESGIAASYNHNATNDEHHYAFCYKYTLLYPRSIDCIQSNTSVSVNFSWPFAGYADLLVLIYNASSYDGSSFLACAKTNISIAWNYGLTLSVELTNSLAEVEQVQHGTLQQHYYTVGCITFVPTVSLRNSSSPKIKQLYYSYDFGDGQKEDSTGPNITHFYNETGTYNYSVNAIAVLLNFLYLHTNLTGDMELLEEVDNINMVVNGDNSVTVGSTAPVTISAEGSVPITACWNITAVSSNTSIPTNPINTNSTFQHCQELLNSTSAQVMMTFNQTGQFAFVALFHNDASYKSDVFTYSVNKGPSPAVVASSTTAVVLGVLLAIVAVILLIVSVYIPYRRYRNRFTETADFKFVDLSEGRSYWQRAKVSANRVVDRVRRPSEAQKTGLVNLIAVETDGEQDNQYGSTTIR